MNENKNIRVVVAMSGGVDSSVAAALLVEQGYDVIGIMMRLWAEESTPGCEHNRCCTPEQMNDARRIADKLSIPFYVLDTKDVFRNTVVEYFITQHSKALTPNPCLECNRHIRFTHLFNHALTLDADYLATGHYARIEETSDGVYLLKKGIDETKDPYKKGIWKTPECLACKYLPQCFGGCRYTTYLQTGSIDRVDCQKEGLGAALEGLIRQDMRYRSKGLGD